MYRSSLSKYITFIISVSCQCSWYITFLHMLSNDETLNEFYDWRSITLVLIVYTICSKLICNRISPRLFRIQSFDQHGFIFGIRMDDAFIWADVTIRHHQEFELSRYLLIMDRRMAFNTIAYPMVMQALRSRGFLNEYIYINKA